ncbi:hypothetical protein EON65_16160 [archaeon]|nr:MAG: hypothetical protein EON65_16160 [archaeon]
MNSLLSSLHEKRKAQQPADVPSSAGHKLKRAAETIALARQIVDSLKDNPEKRNVTETFSAPPVLTKVLKRMEAKNYKNKGTFITEDHRR